MYHVIISFPGSLEDTAFVSEVADRIADYYFQDYQLIYGVHTDTANLHIHFAINAVSYITGLKYHRSKKELAAEKEDLMNIIDYIADKYYPD